MIPETRPWLIRFAPLLFPHPPGVPISPVPAHRASFSVVPCCLLAHHQAPGRPLQRFLQYGVSGWKRSHLSGSQPGAAVAWWCDDRPLASAAARNDLAASSHERLAYPDMRDGPVGRVEHAYLLPAISLFFCPGGQRWACLVHGNLLESDPVTGAFIVVPVIDRSPPSAWGSPRSTHISIHCVGPSASPID